MTSSALAEGVVAVVTGGASGLGRSSAIRLAEAGAAAVIVADVREDPREGGVPTTELVEAAGAHALFVSCDVTCVPEIQAAVGAANSFGGLTTLVTCAGIIRTEDVLAVTEEDFDLMMNVNVKGSFFAAQAAARAMIERDQAGSIILLSSVAGALGSASLPTYNMAKGAIRLMAYSLAASLGPRGIRVNAIHPGVVRTSMTVSDTDFASDSAAAEVPLRRLGEPVDVADTVVYLASPMSAYVSGLSLFVDGGAHSTKAGRQFRPNN
jgi:NAD(P)-dependent dehydrogenase (short-subunit alcohol dehydrogenase family)